MTFNKMRLSASFYDKDLYDMTSLSGGQPQEFRYQYVVYACHDSLLYFKNKALSYHLIKGKTSRFFVNSYETFEVFRLLRYYVPAPFNKVLK